MVTKENKGGFLRNEQVEEDNKVKGRIESPYEGAQDTGDKMVRQDGNAVQRRDGRPQDEAQDVEE